MKKYPTNEHKRQIFKVVKYFGWNIIDRNRLFEEFGKIIHSAIEDDGYTENNTWYFEDILEVFGECWKKKGIIKY